MSKDYEDMSFDELTEAYRAAVDARIKFNVKIRELNESIKAAGVEYKKLQAELDKFESSPVPDGVYREEKILSLIGQRIVLGIEPGQQEKKPRRGRKVEKDD